MLNLQNDFIEKPDLTVVAPDDPLVLGLVDLLEENGFARFPDAPTLRGLKHVEELAALAGQGWRCYVMILLQMEGMMQFSPNWSTHPDFGHALRRAVDAGVTLLTYDCRVTPSSLTVNAPIPADLTPSEN